MPSLTADACTGNLSPGNISPLVSVGFNGVNGIEGSVSKLSPEALARIAANREAARKRKTTRMQAIKNFLSVPAAEVESAALAQAPDIAPMAVVSRMSAIVATTRSGRGRWLAMLGPRGLMTTRSP